MSFGTHLLCAGAAAIALLSTTPAAMAAPVHHPATALTRTGCTDSAGNHARYFAAIGVPGCKTSLSGIGFKPNSPPVCGGFSIGPIADWISTFWTVSEPIVLSQCSDADNDTLTVTSPSLPTNVQIPAYSGSFYVYFNVSDGQGGSAQMWVYVMHS